MLLRFSKCFFFQWSSSFPIQHLLLWNQNMETGWGENLCPFRQHKAFCILNLETRAQLEMRQSTTPSPASQHSFLCNASTKMVEGINYLWMAANMMAWSGTLNTKLKIQYAKTGRYQTICQSMFSNCTCVWVFTGSVPPTFMTWPILLRAPVSPFYEGVVWCTQTAITLFLKDSRRQWCLFFHSHKNQEDLFSRINPNITRNITKTKAFLTFQKQNTTTSCLCGCLSSFLAILTHPVHLPGWHNCRTNRLAPTGKCSISPRRKVLDLEPPRWVAIWHKNSAGWYGDGVLADVLSVCCWWFWMNNYTFFKIWHNHLQARMHSFKRSGNAVKALPNISVMVAIPWGSRNPTGSPWAKIEVNYQVVRNICTAQWRLYK